MTAERSDSEDRLEVQLQGVSVVAQNLLDHLARIEEAIERDASATHDPTVARAAVQDALERSRVALRKSKTKALRSELDELFAECPNLCGNARDAATVTVGLSEIEDRWPEEQVPENVVAIRPAIEASKELLESIVFHATKITIPREVEDRLEKLRIGKAFDFDVSFGSRFTDPERRKQVLDRLKSERIGGWVDLASGLIYRLPRTTAGRFFACAAPFAAALAAAAALYGFGSLAPDDWSGLADGWQLVAAYGLVLAGAVIHLLVENVKQDQIGSAPVLAVSDGIYWLCLYWLGLSLSVLWVVVVTIGLRTTDIGFEVDQLALYVSAGYSLDSVAGLILTRFKGKVAVATKELTKRLEPAPAQGGGERQPTAGA